MEFNNLILVSDKRDNHQKRETSMIGPEEGGDIGWAGKKGDIGWAGEGGDIGWGIR